MAVCTKEELEDMMKTYPAYVHDYVVNLYLVATGARNACLIEIVNMAYISQDVDADTKAILDIADSYGLGIIIENDSPRRYLIAPSDKLDEYKILDSADGANHHAVLGKFLGFLGYDHEWSNGKVDRVCSRTTVRYGDAMVLGIAFVLEESKTDFPQLEEHVRAQQDRLLRVLPDSFIVSAKIEHVHSTLTRLDALVSRKIGYIIEHEAEFQNDAINWGTDDHLKLFEKIVKEEATDEDYAILIEFWQTF